MGGLEQKLQMIQIEELSMVSGGTLVLHEIKREPDSIITTIANFLRCGCAAVQILFDPEIEFESAKERAEGYAVTSQAILGFLSVKGESFRIDQDEDLGYVKLTITRQFETDEKE